MTTVPPATLRLQPHPNAQARLVLLHGWGADADDLLMLGERLARDIRTPLDLVSLQAPERHPQGIGRQWYGLFPPDWQAVPAAQQQLKSRLMALAEDGIPLQSTVVLGFSQGAAMALASGCDLPLAGLIACSGYPHPGWTAPTTRPPVLLIHGQQDDVVPSTASDELRQRLEDGKNPVHLDQFAGGHTIPDVIVPSIKKALDLWLGSTRDES